MNFNELFDLQHTIASRLFMEYENPWEILPQINNVIYGFMVQLNKNEYKEISPDVWIHNTVKIAKTASITAPCIIGSNTEVRHCAFIRGNAIIGSDCVIGNSVELKNVILFDQVQVPHFNYVGDSILGYKAHMGAGSITSNVKSDKSPITIKDENNLIIQTKMKKFGALIGDQVEVGCNSVLNPGTIIGKNTTIYPLISVRGIIPKNCILKNNKKIVTKN